VGWSPINPNISFLLPNGHVVLCIDKSIIVHMIIRDEGDILKSVPDFLENVDKSIIVHMTIRDEGDILKSVPDFLENVAQVSIPRWGPFD